MAGPHSDCHKPTQPPSRYPPLLSIPHTIFIPLCSQLLSTAISTYMDSYQPLFTVRLKETLVRDSKLLLSKFDTLKCKKAAMQLGQSAWQALQVFRWTGGEAEMHARASRWQCEHVARPMEGTRTWELALHITEDGFPAPYTQCPTFKFLADSVQAFPFDNL